MKNFTGYLKLKLGDSYVLLAGGSHKTLSDFLMSSTASDTYVKKAGDTMTGTLTLPKIVYKWQSATAVPIIALNGAEQYGIWYHEGDVDKMMFSASGNADDYTKADLAINGNGSGTVTIRGNTILHAGNYNTWAAAKSHTHSFTSDITNRPFYDSPYSAGEYTWSYNPLGLTGIANIHGWSFKDTNLGTDIGVIQWYLARESSSYTCLNFSMDGNIQVAGQMYASGGFVGNASTSSKWQTTRTLTIGNTGKSVDGSANVSWSLAEIGAAASSHTHSWSDISGIITDAKLPARLKSYGLDTSDHRNIDSTCLNNGFYWVNTGTLPTNVGDAGVITVSANSSYGHQLAFKYSGNGTTGSTYDGKDVYTRIYKGGTWQPWYTILTSGNYTAYAASVSHTHAWSDIIGIITEAKLPYRLRALAYNNGITNPATPDDFMLSGFAYCGSGSPIGGDCNIIGVFHVENSWGHLLCFKFGGKGSTGSTHDGAQVWTRIYNASQGKWLSWYEILTSATYSNYALPLTGGTLTGQLIVDVNTTYPIKLKGQADYSVLNFCDRNGTWRADFGWLNDNRGNVAYMAGSGVISCDSTAPYYSDNTGTFKKYTIYHTGNLTNLSLLTNGPGYLTASTLPYRLKPLTSSTGYINNPDNARESGFWYCSANGPTSGDCELLVVSHAASSWCHQLCFKFSTPGSTGTGYDGKDLWTRMYHGGNKAWTSWFTILTSGNVQNFALPITGGTLTGTLNISAGSNTGSGGWTENIRLYAASNGWTTLMLGASGTGGTNANAWSLHTYGSTFYFANNGSSSFSNGLSWTTAGVLSIKCSNSASFNCNVNASNYYTTSDARKKQNISSLSEHIRKFQFKDTEKWHYGVIAQEVEEMFRDGEEGNMTVNYNSILCYYVGLLENKVSELSNTVKELAEKINALERRLILSR